MNLDEPARFGEVDSGDALGDLEAVADQWAEAAGLAVPTPDLGGIDAVIVTGMGGSGIAGDVAAALAAPALPEPVLAHKGFGLPAFVGPRTLVLAVSHSGNTAETLDAARTALDRGARLAAVAGGGSLAEFCAEAGAPVVAIPRRTPPRHALPLLSMPVVRLLGLDVDPDDVVDAVAAATAAAGRQVPTAENPAKRLALQLAEASFPTVLGTTGIGAVAAYRMACQLAENAELQAASAQVPEAAHNLVACWTQDAEVGHVVLLRDPDGEPAPLRRHADAVAELAGGRGADTTQLRPRGATALGRLASLVAQADLTSVYTALALDRDPTPIEPIDRLKDAISR